MELGKTFKILGHDDHLWMIISDPKINSEQIVLVNFSSWQLIHDQTCIVLPEEHPFIKTRSVVYYPKPQVVSITRLQQDDKYGLLKYYPNLSITLLEKIQRGALRSIFMPNKAKRIIETQFPHLGDSFP